MFIYRYEPADVADVHLALAGDETRMRRFFLTVQCRMFSIGSNILVECILPAYATERNRRIFDCGHLDF